MLHGQHGDAENRRTPQLRYWLFRQIIRGGWQQEAPEDWLANGNPWEFERPEYNFAPSVSAAGSEMVQGDDERTRHIWHPAETVEAVGYGTPIVGWGKHVNTLRLWSARAPDPFKLDALRRRLRRRAVGRGAC